MDRTANASRYGLISATVLVTLSLFRLVEATPAAAASHRVPPIWGHALSIDRADHSTTGISSVSCPTTRFCAAVDGSGHVILFDGEHWSKPVRHDSDPVGYTSVSCASPHLCVAGDSAGFIDTYNGSHWSLRLLDGNATDDADEMSVSCSTASFCAAVDTDGSEWTRSHGTWTGGPSGNALYSLSCASSTFCVAGASNGQGVTWNGSDWSSPVTIDSRSSEQILAVSCSSPTFCVAGGADLTVWNGHRWLASRPVSPSDIESVVCTGDTFCLAGDNSIGNVYRWNGSGWRPSITFHNGETVTSISCPSATFCVAVDDAREAHVYAHAPTLATSRLARAVRGHHYRVRFHAASARGPYRWTKARGSLPPGLQLSRTGVVSGVPTRAGSYRFAVRILDPLGLSSIHRVGLTVRR
jgi:hypothetical protein